MASFLFDVRDALRGLRRDRAYATTVVFTLALTIGATTATITARAVISPRAVTMRSPAPA